MNPYGFPALQSYSMIVFDSKLHVKQIYLNNSLI